MKYFAPLIVLIISCHFALGQIHLPGGQLSGDELVISGERSFYTGKSYLVVETVKLKPGFSVSAEDDGEFYVKMIDHHDNKPPSPNQNFTRTETILTEGVSSENEIAALDVGAKSTSYSYLDGIGRLKQSVLEQTGANSKDIVNIVSYDMKGRVDKSYITQELTGSNGAYVTNAENILTNSYPAGEIPYNFTEYEDSPLNRTISVTGVGKDWHDNNKSTEQKTKLNEGGQVRKWSFISNLPFSSTFYGANELAYTQLISEDEYITKSYSDGLGRTILVRQGKAGSSSWHDTYYIYDDLGRLRLVIPPEASINYNPDMAFANKWYYQFEYDSRGNIIKSKAPGTNVDWVYAVYDGFNRVALIQDGNQRLKSPKEWTFFKYDDLNRLVITGTYQSNASLNQATDDVNNSNPYHHENRNTSAVGYTLNRTFPTGAVANNLLSISYYDNYSFISNSGWDAESNNFNYVNEPELNATKSTAVKGQVTGSKIRILDDGQWLNSVFYYDNRYRPIQVIAENHLNGLDRVSVEHDFAGQLMKSLQTHSSSSTPSLKILEEYKYDHAGRLLQVYHKVNDENEILLAEYNYNERDELVEKNLYSTNSGGSFIQSEDYSYNIRGWLTAINDADLSSGENDLFGMELIYNEAGDITGINNRPLDAQYGGDLTAVLWKRNDEFTSDEKKGYGFEYDTFGRLSRANYANQNSSFTGDGGMYDVRNVTYDENGNIQTLFRKSKVSGSISTIDDLSYTYDGNQLKNVEDTEGDLGWAEDNITIPTEYSYDANGNLTYDLNSKIVAIDYNYLDLPERVEFDGGIEVNYVYDATGLKLSKTVRENGDVMSVTDYVNGVQYENGELAFITHSEGRVLAKGDKFEYEYFMTDHQGSTRLTYGMLSQVDVFKATMETELAVKEEQDFQNVIETRYDVLVGSTPINTTPSSSIIPDPKKVARTDGNSVYLTVGPALQLEVNSGEKIRISTNASYLNSTGGDGSVIASVVDGVAKAFEIVSSGETQVIYDAFNSYLPGLTAQVPSYTNTPKAYMAYIIFPSDYQGTPQFGYQEVDINAANSWQKLELEVESSIDGYAYIYVTNESTVSECYFDDLTIIHDRNNKSLQVTGTADYYPFGMEIDALTYENEGIIANRNKYQGLYAEYDKYTHWSSFELRGNYDSRLGTWYSSDPYDQFGSPYVGMGNNPINGVDPDGGFFFQSFAMNMLTAAAAGAVTGGLYSAISGADDDETKRNIIAGAAVGAGIYGLSKVPWSDVGGALKDAGEIAGGAINTNIIQPLRNVGLPKGSFEVGKMWVAQTIYGKEWETPLATGALESSYPVYEALSLGVGSVLKSGLKRGAKAIVKNTAKKNATKTSTTTINGFKSVGAAGRNMSNIKLIKPNMLKNAGIDAHALKTEFLGPKGISKFDLFRHTETGEVLIMQKGGVGEAIFTGIFL